jgi:hypothetical protein
MLFRCRSYLEALSRFIFWVRIALIFSSPICAFEVGKKIWALAIIGSEIHPVTLSGIAQVGCSMCPSGYSQPVFFWLVI